MAKEASGPRLATTNMSRDSDSCYNHLQLLYKTTSVLPTYVQLYGHKPNPTIVRTCIWPPWVDLAWQQLVVTGNIITSRKCNIKCDRLLPCNLLHQEFIIVYLCTSVCVRTEWIQADLLSALTMICFLRQKYDLWSAGKMICIASFLNCAFPWISDT